MRRWSDLSNQEKSKRISIVLIVLFVFFAVFGTIAIVNQPRGYVPEKDTRPVFGQDEQKTNIK